MTSPPTGAVTGSASRGWPSRQLYDYCIWRYNEVEALIANARKAGQSLLTWQTAALLGTVGLLVKGKLLGIESQPLPIHLLTGSCLLSQTWGVLASLSVAFWSKSTTVPTAPVNLVNAFFDEGGIHERAALSSITDGYTAGRSHLDQLQWRLKVAIGSTAVGLVVMVGLVIELARCCPDVIARIF